MSPPTPASAGTTSAKWTTRDDPRSGGNKPLFDSIAPTGDAQEQDRHVDDYL